MELIRGQRAPLPAGTPLQVTLSARGLAQANLRLLCVLATEKEEVVGGHEVIFDGRRRSGCGSVVAEPIDGTSQTFAIDLARVPANVSRLSFSLSIVDPTHSRGLSSHDIENAALTVRADGAEVCRYAFSGADFARETALCVAEVYRKDGWRIAALGGGFVGGLGALLSRYKVDAGLASAIERGDPLLSKGPEGIRLPAGWPGGQVPELPGGLLGAVGLIVVNNHDGNASTGTGFVVSPGGYVLTCWHVIDDARECSIALEGTRELRPLVPVAAAPEADLALLWMQDRNGSPSWFQLAPPEATPKLGDMIGLLGYPLGSQLGIHVTYSHGIVNSIRQRSSGSLLQVDVGAAPGSSGGPVFNRATGAVVGVLTSGLANQAGMLVNFAVDIRELWRQDWFLR